MPGENQAIFFCVKIEEIVDSLSGKMLQYKKIRIKQKQGMRWIMATKERILEWFESNKGIYFSGEDLAQNLCVSRAAIWKAVTALRKEGYIIDAVTNKGYCMSEKTDILSEAGIKSYLKPEYKNIHIHIDQVVDSTNRIVKEKANLGEKEGYLEIACEQTEGRGRKGRSFYSPADTGVYFSILLRPSHYTSEQAVHFTTMAAAAMCEAIEQVSGKEPGIKWVNDIFLDGKKICGILTEASFSLEGGCLEYAVLGLGINLYPPKGAFPEALKETAGSLFESSQNDMKNRLTAAFLNSFMKYYKGNDIREYVEKYRHYSIVLGKKITVVQREKNRQAFVCEIDDRCHLHVEYENGEREILKYGEIQLKL